MAVKKELIGLNTYLYTFSLKEGFKYAWSIDFPYVSDSYLFFGSKSGAETEAKRLQKRKKYPYSAKLKKLVR